MSGGLHGVGVSVVNALSQRLVAEVRRDGRVWRQSYVRGVPEGPVEAIGEAPTARPGPRSRSGRTSRSSRPSTTTGRPSPRASARRRSSPPACGSRSPTRGPPTPRRTAARAPTRSTTRAACATSSAHLLPPGNALHEEIVRSPRQRRRGERPRRGRHRAAVVGEGYHETLHTFANTINTHEGGMHEEGFKKAITGVVQRFATAQKMLPLPGKEKELALSGEDVREGLTAIVRSSSRDPQFEGQTKTKLGNTYMRSLVERTSNEQLKNWFEEHPAEGKLIVAKAIQRRGPAVAARAARDLTRRKGLLDSTSLPGKLGGLPVQRARGVRALHRRGRLRRRHLQAGPQARVPGDPADPREDPQRREGAPRQGLGEQGDPGAHHRDRHGHRRRVRPVQGRATTRS